MSDTEGEIPPVPTTEQEAEPTPLPEPEKKGTTTAMSKETNVRRFYYILLTVTYGLVCSMITYLFQMYLILMIY